MLLIMHVYDKNGHNLPVVYDHIILRGNLYCDNHRNELLFFIHVAFILRLYHTCIKYLSMNWATIDIINTMLKKNY